jgi:signal transduction histidine kinase
MQSNTTRNLCQYNPLALHNTNRLWQIVNNQSHKGLPNPLSELAPPEIITPVVGNGRIRRALKTLRAFTLPGGRKMLDLDATNSRLNVLLAQSPQAYAVWSDRGEHVIAPHLARWLGVREVETISDVVAALSMSDAASLEGLSQRLLHDGQPFSLRARTGDNQRIIGIQGERRASENGEQLVIFWFSDLTHTLTSANRAAAEKTSLEQRTAEYLLRLEALPMPLWVRDNEGILMWCNASYADMVEAPMEDVVGEQRELMGSKSSMGRALAMRARDGREMVTEKHPLVIKGERRLMQISEMPLTTEGQTLGIAQDMTVLDDMQSELRRFRASTQELLRALNTGIAIFNPKTQLTFYNEAFTSLFPLDDVFLDDKPTIGEIMEALREKRRLPEQADFRVYKKQWQDRFTSLIAPHEEMMHLPDGTGIRMVVVPHPLGGLFMTFEDVTSRLELESSYNTLIAVQRETIDNLAEGLAVWRSDARLALFNPAYAQLWGFKPKELEGTPHATQIIGKIEQLFTPEQWNQAHEILQQATLSRQESRGRLTLNDGRVVEYATIPLPDGGMLNRFNDISDSLKVELALREKNAALEQAEKLKGDFLANVSYQLRTPLNAMMGFAEVLEKQYFGELNERQMEYATGMMQAGEKLIALVNDILDLSTIEAGILALQIRPLEVYPMIKMLHDLMFEWARKQNITLKMDCPKTIGSINADERRLKQVLLNLLTNAIKFTPADGTITLKVERLATTMSFSITDTGIGISKEDQQKIFSPFVQLQQNHRHAGAGLGLSLVKSIVDLHGGEVHLESDIGKGTSVTCLIPLKSPVKWTAPKKAA